MLRGYVGLQGSGKTFSMVNDAVKVLLAGHRVVSNTPIHVLDKKGKKISAIHLEGYDYWDDFRKSENTLYILDEGGIVLSQYNWNKFDALTRAHIISYRKYGRHLFFATPVFTDVVPQLRKYVNEAVACKKIIFPFFGYSNITYRPTYFEYETKDLTIELEKRYILRRKFISLNRRNQIYKYYNHKYVIDSAYLEEFLPLPQPSDKADENIIGKLLS